MARPTLSLALWMQCAGRILRPCGTCEACLATPRRRCEGQPPVILDHSGNVDRHGLPHEDRLWSLDGKAKRVSETKYRTCSACYAYVTGSPCPVCGHVNVVGPREIRKQKGELVQVGGVQVPPKDPKREYFDKQVELSKKRGFAPGYASFKYKEKYGQWPSWAWSQSVKADHAKDTEWQARIEKRKKEKQFWQENAEARKRLEGSETVPEEVLGPSEAPARERVPKRTPKVPVDAKDEPEAKALSLPLVSLSPSGRERSLQDWNAGNFDESDQ